MISVAILLFEDVDVLDAGGPYEVFLTANRLHRRSAETDLFEVATVTGDGKPVSGYGGFGLVPHKAVNELEGVDVVVIPGAIQIAEVCGRADVQAAVETLLDRAELVASVCTGAFLLADRGELDGISWTTHFEDVAALGERIGSERGVSNVGWIDAGRVVTAGGLSSGIAMALHLVDRLASRELAIATARQIEYDWEPKR